MSLQLEVCPPPPPPPPPTLYADDSSSGLSEHSSDLRLSELRATHPPTTGVGGAGNGSGSMQGSNVAIEPVLSDARSKDSNPITSKKKEKDEQKVFKVA